MIVLLNIETATKNCSVSLSVDGTPVGVREIAEENFSHAEKLHVFIEELLKENGLGMKDLTAIAVSQGPRLLYRIAHWCIFRKRVVLWIEYSNDRPGYPANFSKTTKSRQRVDYPDD